MLSRHFTVVLPKDFSSIDEVQYNAYLFQTALYLKARGAYKPIVMEREK